MTALNDHAVRALVAAGTVTLGGLTPRVDRNTTFTGLTFTTTVRVIDRVHRSTTDGRAALDVHTANFAGAQTNLGVGTFARQQLNGRASRTGDLSTLARHHRSAERYQT